MSDKRLPSTLHAALLDVARVNGPGSQRPSMTRSRIAANSMGRRARGCDPSRCRSPRTRRILDQLRLQRRRTGSGRAGSARTCDPRPGDTPSHDTVWLMKFNDSIPIATRSSSIVGHAVDGSDPARACGRGTARGAPRDGPRSRPVGRDRRCRPRCRPSGAHKPATNTRCSTRPSRRAANAGSTMPPTECPTRTTLPLVAAAMSARRAPGRGVDRDLGEVGRAIATAGKVDGE